MFGSRFAVGNGTLGLGGSYSSGIAVSGAGVSRVSTDCSAARRVKLDRRRTLRPPALCGGLPAGGTLRAAAPLAVPSGPSTSMSSSSPTVASAGNSSSSSVQTPLVPSDQRGHGCAQYWRPCALDGSLSIRSVLGGTEDVTPMVVPTRCCLDLVKKFMRGDRYIGRASAQRGL